MPPAPLLPSVARQDYHWWWRSFLVSGGCAIYVFLYSVFYYLTKLEVDDYVSTLIFFSYTACMVFGFWIMTGRWQRCGVELLCVGQGGVLLLGVIQGGCSAGVRVAGRAVLLGVVQWCVWRGSVVYGGAIWYSVEA